MRLHSYINAAVKILELHRPGKPLQHTLKQYFAFNKKHGSRDRKIISSLCYCYYRTGKNFTEDRHEKLVRSLYVCDPKSYAATGDDKFMIENDLNNRTREAGLDIIKIFPFASFLSPRVHKLSFITSMLVQPDLFLRLRPGREDFVTGILSGAGILFERTADCTRLANSATLPPEIRIDRDVVIQDMNSQRVFDNLPAPCEVAEIWDCCAASGGKSILMFDKLQGNCKITATDIRPSIISNLEERFQRAGLKDFSSKVLNSAEELPPGKFDLVICDVPCSGSGTWSRTPEQLFHFPEPKAEEYASLQKRIAMNASHALKPGGHLVYITCSVFAKENEEVVEYLRQNTKLELLGENYLPGYDDKADTLFAAVMTLP